MNVSVTKNGVVVYQQMFEDTKHLNAAIAFLMTLPRGTDVTTALVSNGHDMTFANQDFPVANLVRVLNGIVLRAKKPTTEVAS